MDKPVTIDTILISSGKRSEKSRDMIIRLLQETPSLSTSVLAIGITQRIVERHISKWKAEGILFRDGADNGGCWVILSNDKKMCDYLSLFDNVK